MITISKNQQHKPIEECEVVGSFFDRVQAGRWLREHVEWQTSEVIAWWTTGIGRMGFASAAVVVKWCLVAVLLATNIAAKADSLIVIHNGTNVEYQCPVAIYQDAISSLIGVDCSATPIARDAIFASGFETPPVFGPWTYIVVSPRPDGTLYGVSEQGCGLVWLLVAADTQVVLLCPFTTGAEE